MNYRHAYHAGNFADVLKHALLCWIVRYLQQKPGPLSLVDTHAGAGVYDLEGVEAGKTGEAKDGILRLHDRSDVPPVFAPYLDLATKNRRLYPGSPALMVALARPHDRVVACELHPQDAAALQKTLGKGSPIRIVAGDGYRTLPSLIPPPEKRGLVLIDPPFEDPDEFAHLARAFIAAHRRWPTGVYVLWFPIKDEAEFARFKAELANAGIPKLTLVALDIARAEGLSATGLILCNAPYNLPADWEQPLAWLAATLAQGQNSKHTVERLTGD